MPGITFAEQVDALAGRREALAVMLRFVVHVQQVDVIAALLAPGRQQRVGVLVQRLAGQPRRHAALALLAAVLVAQQVLVGNDIAPVMATGVVHAEQHLGEARHGRQRLQRLGRQRGNTEYHHPPRQPGRARLQLAQALDEARMYPGAAAGQLLGADIFQQRAPQRRLPAHRFVQRPRAVARGAQLVAAFGPVRQPVGAVDLVLIEQIGQALGQLVALAQVGVVGEKAPQWGEGLVLQQCG